MLTFGFSDLLEIRSVSSFASLYDYLTCPSHCELHIAHLLGPAQVYQKLLWVKAGGDPELFHVSIHTRLASCPLVLLVEDVVRVESLIERCSAFHLHYDFKNI